MSNKTIPLFIFFIGLGSCTENNTPIPNPNNGKVKTITTFKSNKTNNDTILYDQLQLFYDNGQISRIKRKYLPNNYDSSLIVYTYDQNNLVGASIYVYQFGKEYIDELSHSGDTLITKRSFNPQNKLISKVEWFHENMRVYKYNFYAYDDTTKISFSHKFEYIDENIIEVKNYRYQVEYSTDYISNFQTELNPLYTLNFWQFDLDLQAIGYLQHNKNVHQEIENRRDFTISCRYFNTKFDDERLVAIEGFGGCGKDSSAHWSARGILFEYY